MTAAVAAELILRGAAYLFVPLPPLDARHGHTTSYIAGLIRFQKPSFQAINASVSSQFGIDLEAQLGHRFCAARGAAGLFGMMGFSAGC